MYRARSLHLKNKPMKRILLFSILIATGSACQLMAQVSAKLYAYSRVTLPGTVRVTMDENGNRIREDAKPAAPMYFVYLTANAAVKITDLYINQQKISFDVKEITETPVLDERPETEESGAKKILVPKTKMRLFQAIPIATEDKKPGAWYLRQLISRSELVVGYIINKKKYYATLKKIIVLEPIAAY